jgi:hypothetical protein
MICIILWPIYSREVNAKQAAIRALISFCLCGGCKVIGHPLVLHQEYYWVKQGMYPIEREVRRS